MPTERIGDLAIELGMFTAAKLKSAETYLARHLVANDYYAEGERVIGRWIGGAAGLLGIEGKNVGPRDAAFEMLRRNLDPRTGARLTQRQRSERIAFFDFQVSAPKSVSILAVTFGDERLRQAHEEAVLVAFKELEAFAARRVRDGGNVATETNEFTGNLAAAAFTHDASRALDAQLHTHLVCANATFDRGEGRWYALQNGEMFRAVEFAGRVYQNALAQRAVELGYAIRTVHDGGKVKGFEIDGLLERDLEVQSRRRRQIEEQIQKFEKERGRAPSSAERHVMATSTRNSKLAEVTTESVRASQMERYSETDRERIRNLVVEARALASQPRHDAKARDLNPARDALALAVDHLAERESVFRGREALTQVLRDNPGRFGLDEVRETMRGMIGQSIVDLGVHERGAPRDDSMFTTTENLRLEFSAIHLVERSRERYAPLATEYVLKPELTSDQREAVTQILSSRDGVMALRGPAGTGKTTTLSSLEAVVRSVGQNVGTVYVAPTHAAKGVLQRDGFSDATTVARLLLDVRNGKGDLQGKLLVVDEAGMQSTRDGFELLDAARRQGARVLLVGDEKQAHSPAAGDFMALLQKHAPIQTTELSTIFRQRANPEYLAAMKAMATGDVKQALAMLDRQGRVHEAAGAYLDRAADAYCEVMRKGQPQTGPMVSVALVAPTWREIDALTERIRKDREMNGELSGPEVRRETVRVSRLTKAQQRMERYYEPGMVVSPVHGVCEGMRQGDWHKISSVGGGKLTLESGQEVSIRRSGARLLVGRPVELPIRAGDEILVQGNNRDHQLTNGTRGLVTQISPDGGIQFRERVDGKLGDVERAIPASHKTLTHGYAMTIHASQGITVDRVIGAVGGQMEGNLWNVLASRGRREVTLFVPDKKFTIDRATAAIRGRPSAMDFRARRTTQIERTAEKTKPRTSMPPLLEPSEQRRRAALVIAARRGALPPRLSARYRHFWANRERGRGLER